MKRVLLMLTVALVLLVACAHKAGSPPVSAVVPAASAPAPPSSPAPVTTTPVVEPSKPALPPGIDLDLNADGVPERISGPLGQWSDQPVVVYDQNGKALFTSVPKYIKRALVQVLTIPGQDRPALLYQFDPGILDRNTTLVWLGPEGAATLTYGWHPKVTETSAETLTIDPDGVIVVTGSLQDPAGHRFERRFRLGRQPSSGSRAFWPTATLESEHLTATGDYPKTPEAVLEAALLAKAYGLKDELTRYFSDPAAAASFAADKRPNRPSYDVWVVQVGKVTLPTKEQHDPVKVEAQPLGPQGGTTGFNFEIGQYEGGVNYYGTVTFAHHSDGRWAIASLKIDGNMFIY